MFWLHSTAKLTISLDLALAAKLEILVSIHVVFTGHLNYGLS